MPANPAKEPKQFKVPPVQGTRNSYIGSQYPVWVRNNRLRASDIKHLRDEVSSLEYKPLFSVVLSLCGSKQEWLESTLDSVLSQVYPNWELCICDDGSTEEGVGEVFYRYERLDERIKVKHLQQNVGISAALNAALSLAKGEYVGVLNYGDELAADAFFEVVKLLQEHPEADLIYSDEDRIDAAGNRSEPHFKPDWSPDLLLSHNYISNLCVYRKQLLEEVGGFREGFEGSQDYDLTLRLTERTNEIHHIPKILYHRRKTPESDKSPGENKARDTARRVLSEALERRGLAGSVEDGLLPGHFRVRLRIEDNPKVSILIPTRDNVTLLRNCIESIERLTTYRNYEILVVDNESVDRETVEYLSAIPHRVVRFEEEFNYSRINNFAVSQAEGKYILLLNDDIEVISGEWLEAMLEHAQRPEVGAVGAKLLYPDGRIQHAGVLTGVGSPLLPGVATHSHQYHSSDDPGHEGAIKTIRNYSAVTAACMMLRKSIFEEVGGFDEENLRVNFNDVDLCLRLRERGYLIVYTPYAELYHHESVSRGYGLNLEEILCMRERWGEVLDRDPYYNPNFAVSSGDFNLRADMLRPQSLRRIDGELLQEAEDSHIHPLVMDVDERRRYMKVRQERIRSSHRTTLLPARIQKSLGSASFNDQLPNTSKASGSVQVDEPQARKAEPAPFFVIGQPKSGTSWVELTLHSHPEIACLGEGKFFGRDFKNNNSASQGWMPSLYSLFADSEDLKTWSKEVGPWVRKDPDTWEEDFERHLKGLTRATIDYFFADARRRFNKPIVGDKTPAHTVYLNEIYEFYPNARIIHVIRDGRDHAISSMFHWWREAQGKGRFFSLPPEVNQKRESYYKNRDSFGPDKQSIFEENYLRGLAKNWKEIVEEAMEKGPRLFPRRYFEVQYEELLKNPEARFGEMMRFLGASSEKGIVEKCVARNSFERRSGNRQRGVEDSRSFYRKGVSGDWKNYFTERDKRIFKEEAGEMLVRLGYERDLNW